MSPAIASQAAPTGFSGGSCELAEILRRYGQHFRATRRLTAQQRKALGDIERCRTAALGGHREFCETCGFERYRYHSCRNRHCPKCQTRRRDAWVEARTSELLPVPYFHHVFTLPHELHPLVLASPQNLRALLKLFFEATATTLFAFGRRTFGGTVGFTLVLHTWDQQLRPHLHLHCLMASGALAPDGSRWIAGGAKFLFPVQGLSKMFRAKFLRGLATLCANDELDLPPRLAWLATAAERPHRLAQWLPAPWVVYSKPPFAGPAKLLDYLGRYTHRVAISNDRLLSCRGGQVRFTYRDRRDGDRVKVARLSAEAFLARFVTHILPERFQRIRHYGLLANRDKLNRLERCWRLLGVPPQTERHRGPPSLADWVKDVLGMNPERCPCCGGPLHRQPLDPQPNLPATRRPATDRLLWDSS